MSGGNDWDELYCDGAADSKRDEFEITAMQGDLTTLSQNQLVAEGRASEARMEALLDLQDLQDL